MAMDLSKSYTKGFRKYCISYTMNGRIRKKLGMFEANMRM
jgi:hypothetical protein